VARNAIDPTPVDGSVLQRIGSLTRLSIMALPLAGTNGLLYQVMTDQLARDRLPVQTGLWIRGRLVWATQHAMPGIAAQAVQALAIWDGHANPAAPVAAPAPHAAGPPPPG
jgi:hypothetical protein